MKEVRITHRVDGTPESIRDETGHLFFFRGVYHYEGQDERYDKESKELFQLADDLLAFLKTRAAKGEK